MAFDEHPCRIELHQVMRMGRTETGDGKTVLGLVAGESASVWLIGEDGKTTTRKPAMNYGGAGQTRADILRDLADWIEHNDDPGLVGMVEEVKKLE